MSAVRELESFVLDSGAHEPDGKFCLIEKVNVDAEKPWSDKLPGHEVVGAFCRSWNNSMPHDERQRLKSLIPLLTKLRLGKPASIKTETRRVWMIFDWNIRSCTPIWLRACGLDGVAASVEALAEITDPVSAKAAEPVMDTAWSAARATRRADLADLANRAALAANFAHLDVLATIADLADRTFSLDARADLAAALGNLDVRKEISQVVHDLNSTAIDLVERLVAVGEAGIVSGGRHK